VAPQTTVGPASAEPPSGEPPSLDPASVVDASGEGGGHCVTPQIHCVPLHVHVLHPLLGGDPEHPPASAVAASGPGEAHASAVHAMPPEVVHVQLLQPSLLGKTSPAA
jgi:hypothetical protein